MARDKGVLSDLQIRHWIRVGTPLAKAGGNGLTFALSTAGVAGWMLRCQHGGRRRELMIGRHSDISLADARGLATIKRAEIMQGRNAAADKPKAKATAAKDWTVRELVKDDRAKKLVSRFFAMAMRWCDIRMVLPVPAARDLRRCGTRRGLAQGEPGRNGREWVLERAATGFWQKPADTVTYWCLSTNERLA